MFRTAQSKTADDLWLQAHDWFKNGTASIAEAGRDGRTSEVLHAALSLSDPRQRWIASREPAINPAFALAEVVWIVQGREDSGFLNYFNPLLPAFAGNGPIYHGAYGHRLRHRFGFDQLKQAATALRSNPASRQIVLQIWDTESDLPLYDGLPRTRDVPCNIVAMLKVRNGLLEWTQVMRSNDLLLGLPHNIVQFTSLQEIMAGWLGFEVGTYNHLSDSLHVYERDLASIKSVVPLNLPPNSDDLRLPPLESKIVFDLMERCIEVLIDSRRSPSELIQQLSVQGLPIPYRNWLAILTADACRRRENPTCAAEAADICTNPSLRFLWQRWQKRRGSAQSTVDPQGA
jgi:thymidylate synthase